MNEYSKHLIVNDGKLRISCQLPEKDKKSFSEKTRRQDFTSPAYLKNYAGGKVNISLRQAVKNMAKKKWKIEKQ